MASGVFNGLKSFPGALQEHSNTFQERSLGLQGFGSVSGVSEVFKVISVCFRSVSALFQMASWGFMCIPDPFQGVSRSVQGISRGFRGVF